MTQSSAIGTPAIRVDGRLKVMGEARYGSDLSPPRPAYAVVVTSPIARGRITEIEEGEARALPGVLDILTHKNVGGAIKPGKLTREGGYLGTTIAPLALDHVHHDGQIVAVVLADTLEVAQDAARRLRIQFAEEPAASGFDSERTETVAAREVSGQHEDPQVGDAEGALALAAVKIDQRYETPTQHHNPIEQNVWGYKNGLADQLGMDPEDIRVVSPYVGGAFGSRGSLTQRTAIIAVATRRLNRPVKLATTRSQGFTIATYRAERKAPLGERGSIAAGSGLHGNPAAAAPRHHPRSRRFAGASRPHAHNALF